MDLPDREGFTANPGNAIPTTNGSSGSGRKSTPKDKLPASELIDRLKKEFKDALESQTELIDRWF